MKKVYLIGYMGSGKNAIGKRLSFATKMPFYDMDREIEKKMGMSIPEIFNTYGEAYFRDLETDFLRNFRTEACIIATGGGVPMRSENREILRKTGLVFFLNASFRDIWRRIANGKNRPIVLQSTRTELEALYLERKPQYVRAAHFKVETEHRTLREITKYIAFQVERLKEDKLKERIRQ
ncbi:shikimate kinase [Sporosarcina sp. HYO08]|uniref:shikimate kinase n=1 Tax=Sporosarcina sp. HYO08 TaxID=1759557 RepID=UPI000791F252|nr:shikimate kinase [Sporosarcina sp. HYO08]KXH87452.1 shikimate kinase [Sporosarcina sp. HYO08]